MNGGQLADFLFSARGRIPRLPFVVTAAALIGLALIAQAVTPAGLLWLGWFTSWPLLWLGAVVTAKRLHDRGRTGWWAALVLVALVAFWLKPQGLFAFLFLMVLIWAAVELGLIAGEQGANRFGPSPQGPPAV